MSGGSTPCRREDGMDGWDGRRDDQWEVGGRVGEGW